MRLYVVRHATAEPHETPGLADADRRLVDEGRAEAALLARAFERMGLEPQLVLTSPLRRCVETARPIASVVDARLFEDRRLRPGFESTDFAALIDDHGSEGDIVLVGHEPDLSSLIGYLSGARIAMPKAGIARLDVTTLRPGGCELRWFMRPKQVRLVATARVTAQ